MCGRDRAISFDPIAILKQMAETDNMRIADLEEEVARLRAMLDERERHADDLVQHAREAILGDHHG